MSHTSTIKDTPIKSITALEAAVRRLQEAGVKCSLKRNAVPRMYYNDQIAKHIQAKRPNDYRFHANPEECDFVLQLDEAYFDVAFLRTKEGHLEAVWDDFAYSGAGSYSNDLRPTKGISAVLGAKFEGRVEHWSGLREGAMAHSIGKLMQEYSRAATIEVAGQSGLSLMGETVTEDGAVHLEFVKISA